jgi:hypothetical protein
MTSSLAAQIAVSTVWFTLYVVLSVLFDRRWDARMRAALGRRLGADVQWARVDASGNLLETEGAGPTHAWHTEGSGSLGRQLGQEMAARGAYLVVLVVLGAAPPLGLLGVALLLNFHALLVLAIALLIIPVFSLFWLGRYRRVGS